MRVIKTYLKRRGGELKLASRCDLWKGQEKKKKKKERRKDGTKGCTDDIWEIK